MTVAPPWQREPWAHQQKEWDLYKDHDARALLWQMRTGKTRSTIDVAFHRAFETRDVDGLLILAPNGVHVNWIRRQLPQHAWIDRPWKGYAWQASERHRPEQRQAEQDMLSFKGGLPVLAINSESLVHEESTKLIKKFLKGRRVMLVADESHNFRSPGSKRTKRIRALKNYCPVRRILTGTAVDNSPLAAYSQFEILETGALGFGRFAEFESHYAEYEQCRTVGGRSYDKLMGYRNLEQLRASLAQWASVVLRSDCEDMSGIIQDERTIILTEEQRNAYASMVKDFLLELEDGDVEAMEPGARLIKLQQILSGFAIGTDGTVHELVKDEENPRLIALLDEVDNTSGKVIVWCKFHEDIKRVTRTLRKAGHGCVEYHGRIHSQSQRQAAIDSFQEDPSVKVFVGQPAAGGSGLDLSAADLIAWYSHTFDLIERSQADERASAIGGKAVNIRDFVVPNTIDTYIINSQAQKRNIKEELAGRGLRDHLASMLRAQL